MQNFLCQWKVHGLRGIQGRGHAKYQIDVQVIPLPTFKLSLLMANRIETTGSFDDKITKIPLFQQNNCHFSIKNF